MLLDKTDVFSFGNLCVDNRKLAVQPTQIYSCPHQPCGQMGNQGGLDPLALKDSVN